LEVHARGGVGLAGVVAPAEEDRERAASLCAQAVNLGGVGADGGD
jgi:hypothetical protein